MHSIDLSSRFWASLPPEERRNTAWHESAHAVMAWLMGGTVSSVRIWPEPVCFARDIPAHLAEQMLYTLSGTVAEVVCFGGPKLDRWGLEEALLQAREGERLDFGDYADAFMLLLEAMPDASDEELFEAFEFWWDACNRKISTDLFNIKTRLVSRLLEERETLDGIEVMQLLGPRPSDT